MIADTHRAKTCRCGSLVEVVFSRPMLIHNSFARGVRRKRSSGFWHALGNIPEWRAYAAREKSEAAQSHCSCARHAMSMERYGHGNRCGAIHTAVRGNISRGHSSCEGIPDTSERV